MFTKEDLVYAYTRQQAIEDGEQIDVSSLAKETCIKYRVFVTRTKLMSISNQMKKGYNMDKVKRAGFGMS